MINLSFHARMLSKCHNTIVTGRTVFISMKSLISVRFPEVKRQWVYARFLVWPVRNSKYWISCWNLCAKVNYQRISSFRQVYIHIRCDFFSIKDSLMSLYYLLFNRKVPLLSLWKWNANTFRGNVSLALDSIQHKWRHFIGFSNKSGLAWK